MGSQDPLNSFRAMEEQSRAQDATVVGGSSPDDGGELRTETPGTAAEMVEQFKQRQNGGSQNMKKQEKKKSVRYGGVSLYTRESLDMETLRDDVFPALEFTDGEKQAAGALVKHPDESQSDVAERCGQSTTTVSRVCGILEGRQDPNEKQEAILRYARENPDESFTGIGNEVGSSHSYVKFVLRAYRHVRVEVDVDDVDDEETQGETTLDDEQDISDGGDDEPESVSSDDVVSRDLSGDDSVTHKYSTDSSDGGATTASASASTATAKGNGTAPSLKSKQDLQRILNDLEERIEDLEDEEPEYPTEVKGRLVSLENRMEGVQSVVDRIENQQSNLERYVEDELDTSSDFEALEQDVQDLKEQCQGIVEATEQNWEETTLGQRVDRIEGSLSSHKEAIQELRERETGVSSEFSTEEKRKIIVALAQNGQDELIDRVLDEF